MIESVIKTLITFFILIFCVYADDKELLDETALRVRAMAEASAADDKIPGMTDAVKEAISHLRILADEKDLQRALIGRFANKPVSDEIEETDAAGLTMDRLDAERLVFATIGEALNNLQRQEEKHVAIIKAAIAAEHRTELLDNHPELDPAARALILGTDTSSRESEGDS